MRLDVVLPSPTGRWPGRSKSGPDAAGSGSGPGLPIAAKARHRARLLLRAVPAVAVVIVLVTQRRSLLSATDRVAKISPVWLALALAAEAGSFVAAAELQRNLLAATGTRMDRRSMIALSYAGTAMSATLPAGPVASSRYLYRTLTRRGSTAGATAWVLTASAVLSIVSLALLGLVGAQIRGLGLLCSAVGALAGVTILAAAAVAVAALVWSGRHRRRIEQLASWLSDRYHALRGSVGRRMCRPPVPAATYRPVASWLGGDGIETRDMLGPARLSAGLGLAGANWLADIGALAISFVALGLAVPWKGLLLAYAVTQLATSVPLLPGSIGVAEGSMAAALVCSGVAPAAAIAGVLVYRFISFWLVIPTGWLAWLHLKRGDTRSSRVLAQAAELGGCSAA